VKILRDLFETSLSAAINADGDVEFPYGETTFPPVEVLQADPTAYDVEFKAWFNDVWLERNRQRVIQLLKLHGNDGRFTDLCKAVTQNFVVPVVGSGMSKASGFPLWRDFLHKLREYTHITETDLNTALDHGAYEEAVDWLVADAGQHLFDERIEHDLRVNNAMELAGPVRFLAEVFPRLVVTTNLDDVLEHVYRLSDRAFAQILVGREIERYRRLVSSEHPILLKIHGDCHRSDGRVLGVAEYDAAYALNSPSRQALVLLCRTSGLLWIGCSLSIDRTVRLMGEVVQCDPDGPRHFAFLRLPADNAIRIDRERELATRKIFPIWYDGDDDEAIEAFLVGILDRTGQLASVCAT
jgi:hypothetical protein